MNTHEHPPLGEPKQQQSVNNDDSSLPPSDAGVSPTEKIAKLRTLVEAALKWGAGPGWQKKAAEILEETK